MTRCFDAFGKCSQQCGWKPEIQVLIIVGYLARVNPELDVEVFTDATAKWAQIAKIPNDLLVRMLFGVVEDTKDFEKEFPAYLNAVASQFMEENKPTKTVNEAKFVVPVADIQRILGALALEKRDPTEPLGYILAQWHEKAGKAWEHINLSVAVINAEPRPVLDFYVTKDKSNVMLASHKPLNLEELVQLENKLMLQLKGFSVMLKL